MEGGGSFIILADGTRVRAEEPTRSHPDGDAPRTADGQVIGNDGLPIGTTVEPPSLAPRRRRVRHTPATLPPTDPAPSAPAEPAPDAAPQPEEA